MTLRTWSVIERRDGYLTSIQIFSGRLPSTNHRLLVMASAQHRAATSLESPGWPSPQRKKRRRMKLPLQSEQEKRLVCRVRYGLEPTRHQRQPIMSQSHWRERKSTRKKPTQIRESNMKHIETKIQVSRFMLEKNFLLLATAPSSKYLLIHSERTWLEMSPARMVLPVTTVPLPWFTVWTVLMATGVAGQPAPNHASPVTGNRDKRTGPGHLFHPRTEETLAQKPLMM